MPNTVAELTQIRPEQLTIVRRMIPWTNRNRPGWKLNPGLRWNFLQHTTGNQDPGADAEMHVAFVAQGGGVANVSFHIVVDADLTVYQLLPFDEVGFHAGDGLDNYWNDIGGWGSIAMELCVNEQNNPARWLKAKQVACATWASILIGDERWDYGTAGPERFTADLYLPHYAVSDDNKWCPTPLLNEGNIDRNGNGPMRDAIRVLAGFGGGNVPDGYPDGMDYGIARMLFGRVTGDDGKNYAYNETGPVSKKWLADGKESGQYPQLVEVRHFDDRAYFRFSNGMTYWKTGNGPIKELGVA
jgi:hypothetical protein